MIVKHPREYVVDKLQYALNPKTIAVVGAQPLFHKGRL